MSLIINSRAFDGDIKLNGYDNRAQWSGSVRQLIGGGIVDQRTKIEVGQEITLSADLDGGSLYGGFTLADRDFLLDLKTSGATVPMEYHGGVNLFVRVMEVELEPLMGEVDPDEDSLFYGDVTLLIKGV